MSQDLVLDHAIANGLLEFWGSDCEACEGNTTCGSMRCDNCGDRSQTVALYAVRAGRPA